VKPDRCTELSEVNLIYIPPDGTDIGEGADVPDRDASTTDALFPA